MAGPVDADRVLEPGLGVCAALKGVPVVCSAASLLFSPEKSMQGKGGGGVVVLWVPQTEVLLG